MFTISIDYPTASYTFYMQADSAADALTIFKTRIDQGIPTPRVGGGASWLSPGYLAITANPTDSATRSAMEHTFTESSFARGRVVVSGTDPHHQSQETPATT